MDHFLIPANAVLNALLLNDTISNHENACALCGNRKNMRRLLLFSKSHLVLIANNKSFLYIGAFYKRNNITMHSTSACCVSAMCGHRELSGEVIYKCPCLPVTDTETIRDELPVTLFFRGCFACRWREVNLTSLGQGHLLPHSPGRSGCLASGTWTQGTAAPGCLFSLLLSASPDERALSA